MINAGIPIQRRVDLSDREVMGEAQRSSPTLLGLGLNAIAYEILTRPAPTKL